MTTLPWSCPRCGPLRNDPLHGADERLHCPNLDCDEIVTAAIEPDPLPPPSDGRRGAAWRRMSNATWKARTEREEKRAERKRQKQQAEAKPRVSTGEGEMPAGKAGKAAKSRWGRCTTCGKDAWLLSKDECAGCYRAKHPPQRRKASDAPKEEDKPQTPKVRRARRAPEPETPADEIAREVKALEGCVRALDGLTMEQAERILRFTASRLGFRERDRTPEVRALPAPHDQASSRSLD